MHPFLLPSTCERTFDRDREREREREISDAGVVPCRTAIIVPES